MTRKTKLSLATAIAVLCAATLGVAFSSAGTAGTTLRFVAHDQPGNFAFDDLGAKSPQGPDIGDVIAFTQTLSVGGRTAGAVHLGAIGVDHRRHLTQAMGTVALRNGTINVAGLVSQSHFFTLAVLGGTGSYTGKHGTLTVATPAHTSTITIALAP
jgi:hypothetical protein